MINKKMNRSPKSPKKQAQGPIRVILGGMGDFEVFRVNGLYDQQKNEPVPEIPRKTGSEAYRSLFGGNGGF